MSSPQPLVLHSNRFGSNPWKVAIVLEELGIPYEHHFIPFSEMKSEPFVSINPNGRVPALEDPNTGLVMFEVSLSFGFVISY
jgi:glutathione S-transferase